MINRFFDGKLAYFFRFHSVFSLNHAICLENGKWTLIKMRPTSQYNFSYIETNKRMKKAQILVKIFSIDLAWIAPHYESSGTLHTHQVHADATYLPILLIEQIFLVIHHNRRLQNILRFPSFQVNDATSFFYLYYRQSSINIIAFNSAALTTKQSKSFGRFFFHRWFKI